MYIYRNLFSPLKGIVQGRNPGQPQAIITTSGIQGETKYLHAAVNILWYLSGRVSLSDQSTGSLKSKAMLPSSSYPPRKENISSRASSHPQQTACCSCSKVLETCVGQPVEANRSSITSFSLMKFASSGSVCVCVYVCMHVCMYTRM